MAKVPTIADGLRQNLDAELERLRTKAGSNFSRYSLTRLHPSVNKRQVRFGIWNAPKIKLSNPQYHVVRAEDLGRLDNIASSYYGDPRLWWAIAHVNRIINPLSGMEVGMTLIIPRREAIYEAMETGNRALFEA